MTYRNDPGLQARSNVDSAAATNTRLTMQEAALQAGCAPAYLAECIAFDQLSPGADGLVDADTLTTWAQQALQPQQLALQAIVDAIDVMEKRSMKPVIDVEAAGDAEPPAEDVLVGTQSE